MINKSINQTRINLIKTAALFLISSGLLTWYANADRKIAILDKELQKSDELVINTKPLKALPIDTPFQKKIETTKPIHNTTYGTKRKILLMGDSEVEGMKFQFYRYCTWNRHQLLAAVTWFSGTDMAYANYDSIKTIIREQQPDYIFFIIGLNQIYQRKLEKSKKAVQQLVALFDTIPYCWIGPANYAPDLGINDLYQSMIPADRFFLSKDLILERADDKRHPNSQGYKVWMDTLAKWIETKSRWPIEMKKPDTVYRKSNIKNIIFVGEQKNTKDTLK